MQRIVHLSDTHIPLAEQTHLHGFCPLKNLKLIVQKIAELTPQPHAVLVTGDMVESGTQEEYVLFKNQLQKLQIPVFWLPGNHDDASEMQKASDGALFSDKKSVPLGAWHLILLNSQVIDKAHGHISMDEFTFLSDELEQHSEKPTLVALHHSPCSPCVDFGCQLNNQDEFLAHLKAKPQVKLVLAGHTHHAEKVTVCQLDIYTAPSTFAQVSHPAEKTQKNADDFFSTHALKGTRVGFGVFDLSPDGTYSQELHYIELASQFSE